jgi:DNA ligase (NAD+)
MPDMPYFTLNLDPEQLRNGIKFMEDYRKALDLDTDGLVIKLQSLTQQLEAGSGERAPLWAAAYKFPPEVKETCLLGVIVQVGKTGQITPVAQLEPVELNGAVVQRASLCNQDELDRLGIDLGDYVRIQRSGEAIPKIIGLARPSPIKADLGRSFRLPKTCPCCSEILIQREGQVNLYCPNRNCRDQVHARLCYAIGKDGLDLEGCGEKAVKLLMAHQIYTLADLFACSDFDFLKTFMARKMREGLEKAKSAPLWRKLSALCIDMVGKITCQDIAYRYGSLYAIMNDKEGMIQLTGKATTESFFNYVADHIDEIERLVEMGVTFREDRSASGPLTGKAFCVTGSLNSGTRDQIEALIRKQGGLVRRQMSKKVDYLVQGEGGGTRKAADATRFGTRAISEEELYVLMGLPLPTEDYTDSSMPKVDPEP